eukprot:SAG25_NODE_3158_length_1191_cov_2.714286_2_plen_154_part_00
MAWGRPQTRARRAALRAPAARATPERYFHTPSADSRAAVTHAQPFLPAAPRTLPRSRRNSARRENIAALPTRSDPKVSCGDMRRRTPAEYVYWQNTRVLGGLQPAETYALNAPFGCDGEIFSTGLFYRGRTLLAVTIAVHTDVTCRNVALPCQ